MVFPSIVTSSRTFQSPPSLVGSIKAFCSTLLAPEAIAVLKYTCSLGFPSRPWALWASPFFSPIHSISVSVSHPVVPYSLQPDGLQPTRLFCPWDFTGKDTGVNCHFLLQGIFLTQEWNPGLLHCRQIIYLLSYKGSPSIPWEVIIYLLNEQIQVFSWEIWGHWEIQLISLKSPV